VARHQKLIIIIKCHKNIISIFITNNIIYLTYIMSKIFVSIACFMDKDIINTINDCLLKAKYPNNLTLGICLQYDTDDDFLKMYDNNPQFKIIKMRWKEAKGPAYARGLIYELFSNETYFFQVDCHTRFFSNWDINLINCLSECKKLNKKSIISHYPININNMNDVNSLKQIANISTVRCIDSQLGIKTHGRFIDINNTPKESWGISAAMLFFDRQAYIDVPFDKEIYHGEQFEEQVVLAARYWTHGYNIYTPTKHIISTEYITNTSRFKERPLINQDSKKTTFQRLTHLLKLDYNPIYDQDNYLGNERTIQDYYKLLGIFDKVKDIFPNPYLNQEQYLNKQVFQEIKIGSVGNGYHFSTYFINYVLNLTYPGIKVNFENSEDCHAICLTHFTRVEDYWNKTNKPFILWNGESYNLPSSIKNSSNIIKFSSVEISDFKIPYAFHAFVEYKERNLWLKYKLNNRFPDRKKLFGYCISADRDESERKQFIENIGKFTKNVYSLGRYKIIGHNQEKVNGKWNSEELQKKYSEFKFILAAENKIKEGYITEKIINVFSSGAIPIYIGDSEYAKKIFNPKAFICVDDFISSQECIKFVLSLSDSKLEDYINEPIFNKTKESEIFTNLYNINANINRSIIKNISELIKFQYDYSLDSIVINLDNEKQKMEEMKRKLNLFGISHSRFSGIIGTEIYDSFKNENRFLNNGYNLRPHQIGCWQSHYKIWQKMIKENIKTLLIFEDDCFFVCDFKERLRETINFINNKNFDIFFLGYSGANINLQNKLEFSQNGCPRCLHAYILTLSGAKKLVHKMETIDYPIDEIIGKMFFKKELNGFRTSYILVYQPWQKKEDKYPLPSKYKKHYQDLI
jgi:GR25 family glycosyltransferase involved in LPS biosynthesis